MVLCTSQNCQRDRCCQFEMYRGKGNIAKQRCTWESLFRSRARGVVPISTPALGSEGRESKFFPVRAAIPATSTKHSYLVPQVRLARGCANTGKLFLPCGKVVSHVHGTKCPTVHSHPAVSTEPEVQVWMMQGRGTRLECKVSFSLHPPFRVQHHRGEV